MWLGVFLLEDTTMGTITQTAVQRCVEWVTASYVDDDGEADDIVFIHAVVVTTGRRGESIGECRAQREEDRRR
jgi:hypothetical protein